MEEARQEQSGLASEVMPEHREAITPWGEEAQLIPVVLPGESEVTTQEAVAIAALRMTCLRELVAHVVDLPTE